MTWHTVDLSELIANIESGGRPHGGASVDSGEIPSLGGENIRLSGGLELEKVKKVPVSFFEHMTKGLLQNEDVLINKDGANTGKVGLYENQYPRAAINEHVFLLRGFIDQLDQRYLYYLLLSQDNQGIIRSKISGSAQPGLKRDFIKNFPVSVPISCFEQSKIAEILTTLDSSISLTRELLIKKHRIRNGLVQDLLMYGLDASGNIRHHSTHRFKDTSIGLIPDDWKISTLSGITQRNAPICYGIVQPREYFVGGVPVVAIKDMKGDYRSNIHLTNPEIDAKYTRSRLLPGDLLISVKGSTGVIDIVPHSFSGNISRDIARVRFNEMIVPSFYLFYFESFLGQKALDLITVGTTRKEISIAPLKELLVPVPSKTEQKKIAEILIEQTNIIASIQQDLSKLSRLRFGLMQDLLRHKVAVM